MPYRLCGPQHPLVQTGDLSMPQQEVRNTCWSCSVVCARVFSEAHQSKLCYHAICCLLRAGRRLGAPEGRGWGSRNRQQPSICPGKLDKRPAVPSPLHLGPIVPVADGTLAVHQIVGDVEEYEERLVVISEAFVKRHTSTRRPVHC